VRFFPWVVDGFLMSILPFLLLVILNVRLIWEVRKSTRYMQATMSANVPGRSAGTVKKEELQITVMLISIVIVFFICQAPYVVYTAIMSINKYKVNSGNNTQMVLFQSLTIVILAFKSAVNFIIYCWFSEKFWATLKKIFCQYKACRRFQEKHQPNNSYYNLRRYSNCTRDTSI
jgi:thyrotropin-releasing hormone receptor